MDDNAAGKEPFLSEDFTSGSSEYSLVLDYPRNFLSRTQWMDSYPSTLRIQRTKWSRLLTRHKWSIFSHNEKKILARKGVPPEFRPKIWIEALKLSAFVNSQRRTYQDYLEESKNTLNQNPVAKNIEKDVDRTFPKFELFSKRDGIASLRNILLAYSVRNREIGYCQSMNFIAGLLLITFSEETAFWSLTVILEDKLPKDYYNYRLLGAHIDIAVLMELLRERVPAVHEMFKTFNIDISVVCVSWFLCIFLNTLPIEEGTKVLFRVSLAIFKVYSEELLRCSDADEVYEKLTKLGKGVYDCDALLDVI